MCFVASILILLISLLSLQYCCHSLPAAAVSNYLSPKGQGSVAETGSNNKKMVKKADHDHEVILSETEMEQWKYSLGRTSKDIDGGSSIEHNDQSTEMMKFKSINRARCRKLMIVVISETHGGHKRKRSRGIDIDYDPPKTHPPSHN